MTTQKDDKRRKEAHTAPIRILFVTTSVVLTSIHDTMEATVVDDVILLARNRLPRNRNRSGGEFPENRSRAEKQHTIF